MHESNPELVNEKMLFVIRFILLSTTILSLLTSKANAGTTGVGITFMENNLLTALSQNSTDCLKSQFGVNSIAPQSYWIKAGSSASSGQYYSATFDDTICNSMNMARLSSIETRSLSMIACPTCKNNNINSQLKTLVNWLARDCTSFSFNGIIYVDLMNQYWDTSSTAQEGNKNLLNGLVDSCLSTTLNGTPIKCGIISSKTTWDIIFNDASYNYPQSKGIPLMYLSLDNEASLESYSSQSFGGWTSPTGKEYAVTGAANSSCAMPVSYYSDYSATW